MRRKIFRLAMLFALATSTALAAGASLGNDGDKNVTTAGVGQRAGGSPQVQQPISEETRKLVEAMRAALSRSTEGLTVVTRPDGSETVDLRGRFQTAFLARVNPDGTFEGACVSSAEEAASFLGAGAKAPSDAPAEKNETRRAIK